MTKQTRQELEESEINWRSAGWGMIVGLILLYGVFVYCLIYIGNLQSQLTELKQNGTYKCDAPKVEAPKIDNTTADYFCGKYNGTYVNDFFGNTYCRFLINDTFSRCDIIQREGEFGFYPKCEVLK